MDSRLAYDPYRKEAVNTRCTIDVLFSVEKADECGSVDAAFTCPLLCVIAYTDSSALFVTWLSSHAMRSAYAPTMD